ncbi:fatty acyl-CoA reductase 1, partial [Aplysia californica]|uniref:Fatty acyl-CoA reductase n=1 Tax=Aplysia californica TaxID=6500 RepID=A0ABM1W3N8_APLCA
MSEDIEAQRSCIANFYKGKTLFITGVTGFMGKVLLEKLLRSCPDIHRVYTLVRPKKGQTPQERIESIIKSKLYDKVREGVPDLSERIVPVVGDVLEPNLGLSEEDEARVAAETQVVFHSAATVKFDEELRLSVRMNVIGVRRMVQLGRKMPNLEALIHVSTAYANCDKEQVKEVVYDPPLHPSKLIDAVEWMDKDAISALTSKLIGSRPNTYTYTKAVAEYLFVEESKGMPVAIVRPSIVGASWEEPLPGWVDNLNGPTGLLAAIGKGLLFIMHGNVYCTADVIPVDIATNAMIAVAWYTAVEKPSETLVYNCTSGQINRLTWGMFQDYLKENFLNNPCHKMLRVPNPRFTLNMFWRDTMWVFDQLIPAYVMDFWLRITGKKPMFVRMQDRLSKAVTTLEFFTSNEWRFHNDNIFMLMSKMTEEDRHEFCFDPRSIDWKKYIFNYCLGVQQYVLKEDISELP